MVTTQADEPEGAASDAPGAAGSPTPPALDGFQRRALRARAHGLSPVAQVGAAGLSEALLAAVDQALRDHELVKVRMLQPQDKKACAGELARASGAALCGLVGHTAILYRPDPEAPRLVLPERPAGRARPDA
jgi:RNA-binding protein